MTTTQHTPEKWGAIPHAMPGFHHRNRVICDDSSGTIIATVRGEGAADSVRDSRLALIAAAPELLAACRAAEPEVETRWKSLYDEGHEEVAADLLKVLEYIRAAIAKAENGEKA